VGTGQHGIFALGTRSNYFLEFDRKPGVDPDVVVQALRGLREPAVTTGGANIVIALGPELCRQVWPDETPPTFQPFQTIDGVEGHHAPATQHDAWVWIHGASDDIVLDVARAATVALAPAAGLVAEQPGFVYRDSRDMTGFIDGTENPKLWEAHLAALVPDGEVGAGGSFVLAMKFVHDLGKFHALPREEQELVVGRTKPDSIELDDAIRPPTSHISRNQIEVNGQDLEIFRRSSPFGTVREQGLYFVAFSTEPERVELMLKRMYGLADGLSDRLLEFTRAVSGAHYFAPSLEALHPIFAAD
jgi:putative iron-dependent peroxidase